MRNIPIQLVLVVLLSFSSITSEAAEVQLPDLLGNYSSTSGNRSCDFILDTAPIEVYDVWIHFSGSAIVGEEYCLFGDDLEGPFPLPMNFVILLKDPVSGDVLWWASCSGEENSGPFEYTLLFEPWPFADPEPTWEFIISNGGTVLLEAHPRLIFPECWYEVYPSATIEEATLLIDGNFPIALETHTWGSIKSLFK